MSAENEPPMMPVNPMDAVLSQMQMLMTEMRNQVTTLSARLEIVEKGNTTLRNETASILGAATGLPTSAPVEEFIARAQDLISPRKSAPATNQQEPVFPRNFKPANPPEVHGAKDVEVFISLTGTYLSLCGIESNSGLAVAVASQFLRGDPASWFAARQKLYSDVAGGFATFNEFAANLRIATGIRDPVKTARENMMKSQQRTSVAKYREDFGKWQAYLPVESGTAFAFFRGLKEDIRLLLIGKCNYTVDSWERIADLAEEMDREKFHAKSSAPYRPSVTPSGAVPMELGVVEAKTSYSRSRSSSPAPRPPTPGARPALKPLTDAERDRLRTEGRCFKCREKGHVSSVCPTKVAPKN